MAKKNVQQNPAVNTPVDSAPAKPERERKKRVCPLTKDEFMESAKPIPISIGGQTVVAGKKEFKSGSFGWYANGKVVMEINGVPHTYQLGLNLTAIGSKPNE